MVAITIAVLAVGVIFCYALNTHPYAVHYRIAKAVPSVKIEYPAQISLVNPIPQQVNLQNGNLLDAPKTWVVKADAARLNGFAVKAQNRHTGTLLIPFLCRTFNNCASFSNNAAISQLSVALQYPNILCPFFC